MANQFGEAVCPAALVMSLRFCFALIDGIPFKYQVLLSVYFFWGAEEGEQSPQRKVYVVYFFTGRHESRW